MSADYGYVLPNDDEPMDNEVPYPLQSHRELSLMSRATSLQLHKEIEEFERDPDEEQGSGGGLFITSAATGGRDHSPYDYESSNPYQEQ